MTESHGRVRRQKGYFMDNRQNRVPEKQAENMRSSAYKPNWLKGRTTQLMVFLNGVILTITAFAILSVFINDMVRENTNNMVREAETHFTTKMQYAQDSFYSLKNLFSPYVANIEDLKKQILLKPDIKDFKNIFLVQTTLEGLEIKVFDLVDQKPLENDDRKFKHISEQGIFPPLKVVHEKGLSFIPKQNQQEGIYLADFMGIKDGITFFLIADLEKSIFFDQKWLENYPFIRNISIRSAAGDLFYVMDQSEIFEASQIPSKATVRGAHKAKQISFESFDFSIGNQEKVVELFLDVDDRQLFLKNIPILMLLFGTTLTIIGTLFVHNNQKQSDQLTTMNVELKRANEDLNKEISQREFLYQALKKAERENRAIMNSVSDIIFECDEKGNLLFINDSWTKVTGFDSKKTVGKNIFDMIQPQDIEDQKESLQELIDGKKQAYRAFTKIKTAQGSYRAVEMAISMIRMDENKALRLVGTFTDVEARRRAERALGEAEKKYRTIVENAAGGIYQMGINGHYLSANPSMAKILGYESPEDVLMSVQNATEQVYCEPNERRKFLKALSEADRKKVKSMRFESQILKKDGTKIWVSENVRVVSDDEGNTLYFEGSMEDITQRKEAELALREAKIYSDLANRAKSEFLTNMSHELRTPLNAIIGFSEIIVNQAFGPVGKEEYCDYAQDIHQSGKELLNLINDILDISKIEAGERKINDGIVDLYKTASTCLSLTNSKMGHKDLNMMNNISEDVPKIIGEEMAIKQMLMNLLSNAVKFTPEKGTVTVAVENDHDGGLRLSVTDTGIGLDEDEIKKALSPFGQVDGSHKKEGAGAGLGLTLVNALIKLHQGKLELFSQKGIGTTVSLIFPPKRVSNPALNSGSNNGSQGSDDARERQKVDYQDFEGKAQEDA